MKHEARNEDPRGHKAPRKAPSPVNTSGGPAAIAFFVPVVKPFVRFVFGDDARSVTLPQPLTRGECAARGILTIVAECRDMPHFPARARLRLAVEVELDQRIVQRR